MFKKQKHNQYGFKKKRTKVFHPFVIELTGKMFLQPRANTIIAKGQSIVDLTTGEILYDGILIGKRKVVDKSQFAKIYASEIGILYELSQAGKNVFLYLTKIMDYENKAIFNSETEYAKAGYKTTKPVHKGLKELIKAHIIAAHSIRGIWWLNPTIVCKGERFAKCTEYVVGKEGTAQRGIAAGRTNKTRHADKRIPPPLKSRKNTKEPPTKKRFSIPKTTSPNRDERQEERFFDDFLQRGRPQDVFGVRPQHRKSHFMDQLTGNRVDALDDLRPQNERKDRQDNQPEKEIRRSLRSLFCFFREINDETEKRGEAKTKANTLHLHVDHNKIKPPKRQNDRYLKDAFEQNFADFLRTCLKSLSFRPYGALAYFYHMLLQSFRSYGACGKSR